MRDILEPKVEQREQEIGWNCFKRSCAVCIHRCYPGDQTKEDEKGRVT
jgi:hypothetical protein